MPMIEIRDVSKWYGSFQVLTDCTTNVGDRDGTTVEMVLFAGAVYFVICVFASALVKSLQKKVAR